MTLDRMESLLRDLRHGVRALRRAPGFTLVVVLTLGVAIGVNTAVFTVTNAVLFKGFRGISGNERILYIGTQRNGRGCCASFPDFVDWRAQSRSFSDLAAVADLQIVVADDNRSAEHFDATQISPNGFRLLGRQPILGRDFEPGDAAIGAAPVAILHYNFWRVRYRQDPAVLGKTIRINGTPTTIVGVMPEDFSFPQNQDLWLPLVPTADLQKRDARTLWFAFGRLVDDAHIETARAELAAIGRGLAIAYPGTNDGWIPQPRTFAEIFVARDAVAIYGTLWAAVGFVVLIACTNIANLVLSRGAGRAREWSVLAALGASRFEIVRRQVAETIVLSSIGGVAGWCIARGCLGIYAATANPVARSWSANLIDYAMDRRVLVYVAIVSIVTTILAGVAPALYLSRVDAGSALDRSGRTVAGSRRGRRLSRILIAVEIATALVLLVGAAVMVRSFASMARADLGIRPADVHAILVRLPRVRYSGDASQIRFFDQLTARLAEDSAVRSVAVASELPAGNGRRVGFELPTDAATDPEHRQTIMTLTVGPGYFDTIGATVLSGRDFTHFDDASSPTVAIVNQRFADTYWRGEDPLGKQVRVFDGPNAGAWTTVVGVVSNVVQNVTDRQVKDAMLYSSYRQRPASSLWVVTRMRNDAPRTASTFRAAIDAIDPDVPIWIGPQSLNALMAAMGNYWLLGNNTVMFAGFAAIALFLASLGIYAVAAYSVARRTRELGIRMAIGATRRDVLALVVRESAVPLGIGTAAGAVASLALTPTLRSQLVNVSPNDPLAVASAVGILLACGLLGSLLPAYRATCIGPATALRHE
jgi:putative ABC transport system permease protein